MLTSILRRRADATAGESRKTPEPELDRRGYRRSPRKGTEPLNKGKRYPAEPLTGAEVYELLRACDRMARRPETGGTIGAAKRNRALIMVLWRSGLRCAEVLALMPKDVDLEAGRIAVLRGKGAKRRTVGLDREACAMLAEWMAERAQLGVGVGEAVFCVINGPTRGQAINAPYVRDLLKRLARNAGIQKRVHPHGFRHTYAAWLLEQGVPVLDLQKMLGHTDPVMTFHYADHLLPFQALERVNGVQWPRAS
jgi:integrase